MKRFRVCAIAVLVGTSILCATMSARAGVADAWTAFRQSVQQIQSYTETVDAFEVGANCTQRRRYHVFVNQRSYIRSEIVQGDGAGSVAVWRGGSTVRAHRGGIISFITLTLSEHDPRVMDCRHNAIDASSFASIIALFEHARGIAQSDVGDSEISDADALTITPTNSANEVSKVTLYVSKSTHLPVALREWSENTLVEDVRFSDVRVNVALPDTLFSM